MMISKRERTIAAVTLAAVALLLLDHFAISPILDAYDQVRKEENDYAVKLADANSLFMHQNANEARWKQMEAGGLKHDMATAAADTENELEDAVFKWAQDAGLTLKSWTPAPRRDRPEVVLYVVGTGPMSAVAQFLYQAQTSKLPVKPEDVEITARKEGADDLTVTLHLSGLYLPAGWKAAPAGARPPASGGNRS